MDTDQKEKSSVTSILEVIGKKLIELRIRKGYTSHVTFAEDFNLPRVQYWRMEKGKANFTLKSLNRVLAVHGVTFEQLFTEIAMEGKKNGVVHSKENGSS
jgi:transcriptional regulator with XRE-family HTH domain